MNDEINESFIFSIEETEKYLQKSFLTKLYNYYQQNGYFNMISNQIVNILISIFLVIYSLFVVNCIQWNKVKNLNEDTHFRDLIEIDNLFKLNFFMWLIFIMYVIIIVCKLGSLINDIKGYNEVIYLLKLLDIKDKQLYRISWEQIISKMSVYVSDTDVYKINLKICIRDNYFITIVEKKIIDLNFLCELMEWNIKYCFINSLFSDSLKLKKEFLFGDDKFINKIKSKTQCVAIGNFIFMPFIITYLLFFNLLTYGENIYNKPQLLAARGWSRIAKWKFRNYNELQHEFHEKINDSLPIAEEYASQFPSRIAAVLSKLCLFIFSSFFITMVGISIYNQQTLVMLFITNTKSIIWFIGIFASVITVLKTSIKEKTKYHPEEKMVELKNKINCIPDSWVKEDKEKLFFEYFQFQIVLLIKEIWHTLLVPFNLFKLSFDSKKIINKLNEVTITSAKYGNINKFALFDNNYSINEKTELSLYQFRNNNPNWEY